MKPRPERPGWLWPVVLVLLAAAPYLSAIGGPFLYDDVVEIRDNPRVHSLANIPSLLTSDFWGGGAGHNPLYRPLTAVITTVVYAVGNGKPWPFHALNILLHAAACLLAFLLIQRLTGSRVAAVAAALLFAVHPVHSEAVAWISGDAEIVSTLLILAAWLAHLEARTILAAFLLALGLLSKEGAVVFPALIVAGDILTDRPWRSRLRPYAISAGVVGAYLLLRLAVLGHLLGGGAGGSPLLNPLRGAPLTSRLLTSMAVIGRAIVQSVFPRTLCLDYGFDQIPVASRLADSGVLPGLAAIGALAAAAIFLDPGTGSRPRPVALGAAIFFVAFLPTSNLLFPGISIFAERNLYLPVLGICLMAAVLLTGASVRDGIASRGGARTAGLAALAILTLAAGARTLARGSEFRDPLDLYGSAVASCPRSARAHSFLGIALREAGRAPEAVEAQRRSLAIAPDYSDAHAELGLCLAGTGDMPGAEKELKEALRLNPDDREARGNLSSVYAETGRIDEALGESRALLLNSPDDPELLANYAAILLDRGRDPDLDEARQVYLRVEERAPASAFGPNGLGVLYARSGKPELAAAQFEEALRRSPGDLNATYNLAKALAASGRVPAALEVIDRALASGARDEEMERLRNELRGSGADRPAGSGRAE